MTNKEKCAESTNDRDAIDTYFECVTACSLNKEDVECTTKCVEVHLKSDNIK